MSAPSALGLNRKRKHRNEKMEPAPRKTKKARRKENARSSDSGKHSNAIEIVQAFDRVEETQESSWTVSGPIGGKVIDRDPLFSPDEKLVIFANEYAVQIYKTSDSTLLHSLPSGSRGAITSYALSAIDTNILWVATHEGCLFKADVETGKELGSYKHQSSIQTLIIVSSLDGKQDTLFTVDTQNGWSVTAHRFGSDMDHSTSTHSMIYPRKKTSKRLISSLKVLDGGNIVAMTTQTSMIIGELSLPAGDCPQNFRYTWREVKFNEPPVCFDIRTNISPSQSKPTNQGPAPRKTKVEKDEKSAMIDVVVGGLKGVIYMYDDFLNRLKYLESPSMAAEESRRLAGKKMHWHRDTVGSVTWSKDGNYVISGGKEAVLVLWQLATGRSQFLPNLESPIQSIVVSPSGSSYAVRLGDNSVMVLSTSELQPTAYVAGLQSTSFTKFPLPQPDLRTVDSQRAYRQGPIINRVAAVINPSAPNHIIAAVPAFQDARGATLGHSHASYIQDFDLSASNHIIRQAVARTNAVASNRGPEGNRIQEPEVLFLQLSQDGRWLATVDEWAVPPEDLRRMKTAGEDKTEVKEIRLRFWSWDSKETAWMLNTRIEDPHEHYDNVKTGSVLDLASNPTESQFATLGTDSIVRIWLPLSKDPSGRVTKMSEASSSALNLVTVDPSALNPRPAQEEIWWTVEHNVHLEKSMSDDPLQTICPSIAKLCYSNDGSTLAAYQGFKKHSSDSAIYLIDVRSGVVREILRDFAPGDDELHGLAFLERYLICVGQSAATIWDVTTFEMHAHIPLRTSALPALRLQGPNQREIVVRKSKKKWPLTHLAVDVSTSTFAIAVPVVGDSTERPRESHPLLEYQSRILLFSPEVESGSLPFFTTTLPRLTSSLLPAGGLKAGIDSGDAKTYLETSGFVVLDVGAEVRIVTPVNSPPKLANGHGDNILENSNSPTVLEEAADEIIIDNTATQKPEELSDIEADDTVADIVERVSTSIEKYDENKPVVRSEQLAEAFDYPTNALPSMEQLFHNVLHLYVEKPTLASDLLTDKEVDRNMEDVESGEKATNRDGEFSDESESEDSDSSSAEGLY